MRKPPSPPQRQHAKPARTNRPAVVADGPHAGVGPGSLFAVFTLIASFVVVFRAQGSRPEHILFMPLIVAAAGLVGYALFRTLQPLTAAEDGVRPGGAGGRPRAALEREKALTLRAIKDLEFDRAMGKVSNHDWEEMSGALRARAVRIMRDLDRGASALRAEILRELNARRLAAGLPAGALDPPGVDVPPPGLAPQSAGESPRCGACGTSNDGDARFCKSCGSRIEGAA